MNEGWSVIINLGNVGDAGAQRLLGALLLVQIEQAALSRTHIPAHSRRPWTVLLDEWPVFAASERALATILEQTREFGLRLYLAAQSTSQVSSDRLEGALENCGVTVTFAVGRASAVEQSRQLAAGQLSDQETNLIARLLMPRPLPYPPTRNRWIPCCLNSKCSLPRRRTSSCTRLQPSHVKTLQYVTLVRTVTNFGAS